MVLPTPLTVVLLVAGVTVFSTSQVLAAVLFAVAGVIEAVRTQVE